jgi:hypothetical protein
MDAVLIFSLCFLLLPLTAPSSAQGDQLPEVISSTLSEKFPGWRLSKVSGGVQQFFGERLPGARPNLIKGDFDGDGRTDYAVLIEHSNFDKAGVAFSHVVETLAFLKRGAGYGLFILQGPAPTNLEMYLNLAKKGESGRVFQTGRKFRYPNDSISVSYFEKAGGTYIFRKGKFRYVTESD